MRSRSSIPSSRLVAYIAVMTSLSAVIGYLEMLVPVNIFGIPGVKLGLANAVSLVALYMFGAVCAYLIMAVRVLLLGFMFGNMYSILFGMAGGLLSITAMLTVKKTSVFTMTGVSTAGGVFHNLGQLAVAYLTLKGLTLKYYIPLLVIAGTVCGFIVGITSSIISERVSINDRIFKGDSRSDL